MTIHLLAQLSVQPVTTEQLPGITAPLFPPSLIGITPFNHQRTFRFFQRPNTPAFSAFRYRAIRATLLLTLASPHSATFSYGKKVLFFHSAFL